MERFGFKKKLHIKWKKRNIKWLLIFCVFLVMIGMNWMDQLIEDTLHVLCEAKVESIGITISNKVIDDVMDGVTYEDLVTFVKSEEGKLIALKSNIVKMNQISSEIAVKIQEMYDELDKIYVYVPLRKFYRKRFF